VLLVLVPEVQLTFREGTGASVIVCAHNPCLIHHDQCIIGVLSFSLFSVRRNPNYLFIICHMP